ncbi:hypothetical protein [Nocardia callitridis]|uniref:Uncharacterized protein n=1 Tax=Nocardia callitridis TaxID=648753 RepID=A0ABP9K082_9NOCA
MRQDERTLPDRVSFPMVGSTAVLAAVGAGMTVFAGPALAIADRAADKSVGKVTVS